MTVRFASIIALMLASASAPVPAPGPATGTPAPAGVPGETPGTTDTGGSCRPTRTAFCELCVSS